MYTAGFRDRFYWIIAPHLIFAVTILPEIKNTSSAWSTSDADIENCLLSDRFRFRRLKTRLQKSRSAGHADEEAEHKLLMSITRSRASVEARKRQSPAISFPAELPITARLDEISSLIAKHQVIILCGETGSGKSTQIPKICLAQGRGIYGRIGHTQPRRIAARSLCNRVASEVKQKTGESVGFKVRFDDQVKEHTSIKMLTDGMLLAEVQKDRYLNEYDTIIIDEAHERSLNIDFLLGYLKQILVKRPELKLIVTSATIDTARFSEHFNDAPVIEVSGRTFPVDIRYRELPEDLPNEGIDPMQQGIVDAVDELSLDGRGDILVFLPGEREIRETADALTKHSLSATEVLPLFARLSVAEQGKIFRPQGLRRIILATNVAETSLTVPGIRYVIDSGFAKISRYSHRSKIQRLPVERISQASAAQRAGRCGRVANGICIRLYSEEVLESCAEFTEPEIQRTNLASVILQMKMLGFGELDKFPFVNAPDRRLIKDGYRVLEELSVVDGLAKVTRLGKQVSRLSVDPRIARMLMEAAHSHCLQELLVIAAALSVQDPRDRPMDKKQQADTAHELFNDEQSDFMGYLKLWAFVKENRLELTQRKFRRLCKTYFLSFNRLREWQDIHRQLRQQMLDMGFKENQQKAGYEIIHMAILSGLLSHIGFFHKSKEQDYLGARNSRFYIFPGSSLFASRPKWLVSAELVETAKLYARTNAVVQPQWIEKLAGHLLKRNYSEPHWQAKSGQVGAYEKVTLYGITLVPRRRVNFGPINPKEAREIFIRFALVAGDFKTRSPFWRHNRQLIDSIHLLEAKARRRDVLVSDEAIFEFYDKRIPEAIYSTAQLERWIKKSGKQKAKILYMSETDILARATDDVTEYAYPDALLVNRMHLPLEYRFDPARNDDGVTVKIPHAIMEQIQDVDIDRLVPGLLREKLLWLIRGLPKSLRKNFVPAPDYAQRCLPGVSASALPLIQAFAKELKRITGVYISEDAWPLDDLPEHLKMHIDVVDQEGKCIKQGRDLPTLKKQCRDILVQDEQVAPDSAFEKVGLTRWDFGDLPETMDQNVGNMTIQVFPALVDNGDSAGLALISSRAEAERLHNQGIKRLLKIILNHDIRFLKKQFADIKNNELRYSQIPADKSSNKMKLVDEIVNLILQRCFLQNQATIREQQVFLVVLEKQRNSLVTVATETYELITNILMRYHQLRKQLGRLTQINWLSSVSDMQQQLDYLVYRGFIQETEFESLRNYPRYLNAIEKRIEKLKTAAPKDQATMQQMANLQNQWQNRVEAARQQHRVDPRLEDIRWMLEELRVSLFAQELKTAYPVSVKRIDKRWQALGL